MPVVAPALGGVLGSGLYEVFIGMHLDVSDQDEDVLWEDGEVRRPKEEEEASDDALQQGMLAGSGKVHRYGALTSSGGLIGSRTPGGRTVL